MSIPANITAEIAFLQSQVKQNKPLTSAPRAQVVAMKLNAAQLVADTDAALLAAAGTLDTWTTPVGVAQIISGIEAISASATNQSDIALCRGIVGRVASNINQLP